jgi:hypothetical protein
MLTLFVGFTEIQFLVSVRLYQSNVCASHRFSQDVTFEELYQESQEIPVLLYVQATNVSLSHLNVFCHI